METESQDMECLHLFVSSLTSLTVTCHALRATSSSAPTPVQQMDLWIFILERRSLENSLMQTNKQLRDWYDRAGLLCHFLNSLNEFINRQLLVSILKCQMH